jgi:DNA polymerase-1
MIVQHPFVAEFPNVREMFTPDPGYTLCATDLDRADLQVVAWDSGCETIKQLLKEGLDVHLYNAGRAFHLDIPIDRLRDPDEATLLAKRHKKERNRAKAGGHATNYIVQAKRLSEVLGITEQEAQDFIDWYFGEYPEIKEWHQRIWHEICVNQYITNAFGYVSRYFNRINDATLREAVAWIPQSTVGLTINKAWDQLELASPVVQVILQVHDELIYQVPTNLLQSLKPTLKSAFNVRIPYDDPLVIPAGLKTSTISWGHVENESW